MLHCGDTLKWLPTLSAGSADAVVTDPPYGLGFMGQSWDCFSPAATAWRAERKRRKASANPVGMHGRPGEMGSACIEYDRSLSGQRRFQEWCQEWGEAVLRVLQPGGYMACSGGTRTYHRLASGLEDAGFEIRDCLLWLHGQGFPKSRGCLKPAWEPILLARKPGPKVLPLGIDECRIVTKEVGKPREYVPRVDRENWRITGGSNGNGATSPAGRWPANLLLDEEAAAMLDEQAGPQKSGGTPRRRFAAKTKNAYGDFNGEENPNGIGRSSGQVSRFFYCPKAGRRERGEGNKHPTVKPLALVSWLVRLVCPPDGLCLDPFLGSGTTGVACVQTGRRFLGCEIDPAYFAIARRRIAEAQADAPLFQDVGP